jgi:hypothetical protein
LGVVVGAGLAAPAEAIQRPDRTSPFCSYRSYKHLMPRFVPAESLAEVRVFPGRIRRSQRDAISRDLALGIGRSELGRHTLYVPVDGEGRSLGLLRIHSEPGDHGLVFMGVFLDRELRVAAYSVIQYRGRAKAWLEGRRDLRERLRGADAKTLRSWLDGEGRELSPAGIAALGLGSCSAVERRIVVHLVRIAAKAIATTEAAWGGRMRALGYLAPRPPPEESPQTGRTGE